MFGALPPNSSETFVRLSAADFAISFPTSVEPVKATLVDAGMCSERGAGSFTITGNDIDDTFRKSCFLNQLREFHRADRRLLSGFEHHRVSGRQRRREFPRGHQQRKIPGNDLTANTDRFAQRVVEHLAGNRNRFAFDLRGPAGEVFKVLNHLRKIDVERLFDRLAIVSRFQRRQFSRVLFDQL